MFLDELPDLALQRIFSKCNAEDIESLRRTNLRLFDHITDYRLHYSRRRVSQLKIKINEDGLREIEVVLMDKSTVQRKIVTGPLNNAIRSLSPVLLNSYDHDELADMNGLWWKGVTKIILNDIIDYHKYLPYFDQCHSLYLRSTLPIRLSEILQFMETEHLKVFNLSRGGDIECTNNDLKKIALLSNQMEDLQLRNLSPSSRIFIDDLLDLIENGSFTNAYISVSRIGDFENAEEYQVLIKWIATPINPADINQIQGVYPVKPQLPAVGGNEGFGKVEKVGSSVEGLKTGDLVIPNKSGLGTWRELSVHTEKDVFQIDSQLPLEYAAVFQVNPPTAYRMLKDYINLKPGDTVIQNGANSAVGKQVIQICRILGVNTVNVVRNRENLDDLVAELKNLGATDVITEEDLYARKKKFSGVKLALNCVGGRSSLFLANVLDHGGCMVTYGGMSKQPVQSPTGPLIFKDISLRGFWMSRWYDIQKTPEKRSEMYADLAKWMKSGEMAKQEFVKNPITQHAQALNDAMTKFDKKQLFVLE